MENFIALIWIYMCFRAWSRSPEAKLSLTTVNNSFQLFPIFVKKSSILDVAQGKMIHKNFKWYQGHPPGLSATLGKYGKLTILDALKYISRGFLHYASAFNIKWTKQS